MTPPRARRAATPLGSSTLGVLSLSLSLSLSLRGALSLSLGGCLSLSLSFCAVTTPAARRSRSDAPHATSRFMRMPPLSARVGHGHDTEASRRQPAAEIRTE